MFVFVDESSKGRNETRRRRAWGPRGTDTSINEIFDEKGYLYTLMGVADIAGMVQGACEIIERKVNDDDDDPTRGTVDADRFVLWVQEKLIPSLGSSITHANMCGYYRKVGCIRNVPQAGVINIKDQEAVTFAATVAVLAASIQESNSESDSSEDGI